MANSLLVMRCRWCRKEIYLAKGYCGRYRYLPGETPLKNLIEEHGWNCPKSEEPIDYATDHFQIVEFYSDEYDIDPNPLKDLNEVNKNENYM